MREANAIQTLHASKRVMCIDLALWVAVRGWGVAARGVRGEGGRG